MAHLTPEKSGSALELYFFDEQGAKKALKKLGWKETNEGLVDENRKPIKCDVCGGRLKTKEISSFFPGSTKKSCMKLSCFMGALYEAKKLEVPG